MIETLTPVAALVAGLVGSGHCMLMCGGIAGALELSVGRAVGCAAGTLRFPLLYNLGRISSYAIAGAIAGTLGDGTLALAGLPQVRVAFALFAALVVIVVGLRLAAGPRQFGSLDRAGVAAWRRIAPLTRGLFPVTTPARAFGVGLAWGWLPCGMAYAMLVAAWLSGDAPGGAAIMAMFGIGTLPAMLALGGGAARLLGSATKRWGGALLVVLGVASAIIALTPSADHATHHPTRTHEDVKGSVKGSDPFANMKGTDPSVSGAAGVPVGHDLAGEVAQPVRVEDVDRLALHLDHAQLGQP